ncbi:hypothetical protein VKT23_015898 [Stygiomarasmius scandens]|uniref:Uncharacterized protein n=1 Tax=Marasmiellus scandens TaxID=2682957 RepID=A0ABR1IWK1_9AGAR
MNHPHLFSSCPHLSSETLTINFMCSEHIKNRPSGIDNVSSTPTKESEERTVSNNFVEDTLDTLRARIRYLERDIKDQRENRARAESALDTAIFKLKNEEKRLDTFRQDERRENQELKDMRKAIEKQQLESLNLLRETKQTEDLVSEWETLGLQRKEILESFLECDICMECLTQPKVFVS